MSECVCVFVVCERERVRFCIWVCVFECMRVCMCVWMCVCVCAAFLETG